MFNDIQYALIATPLNVVFADEIHDDVCAVADYLRLVESMNFDIAICIEDETYSGDSRYLLKHGDFYGILIFGWGSCSGCDSLQSCDTIAEVEELRKHLFDSITWGSAIEILSYVRDHDWQGDYSSGSGEMKQFVNNVDTYLTTRM